MRGGPIRVKRAAGLAFSLLKLLKLLALLTLLTAMTLMTLTACHTAGAGPADPGGTAAQDARPAVPLPPLGEADPAVRDQLREGFEAFERVRQDATASTAALAAAYGQFGQLLLAARFGEPAEMAFREAQTRAPDDRRWPYYLGHLYKARGDHAKALTAFQRASDLAPDDVPSAMWLGEMQLMAGRVEQAQALFERIAATSAGRLAGRVGLGRAALTRRDYAKAVEYLESALALSPKALSVHAPLAQAYRGLGDGTRAEHHARLVGDADLSPTDPLMDEVRGRLQSAVSYELAGTRALNQGDWKTALDAFDRGLALERGNPALQQKLGTALFLSGDRAAARRTFEALVRESPAFAKGHFSLGALLLEAGDTAGAERHLREALRQDPGYVEAHVALAELWRKQGRLEDAVRAYDRALAIEPRQPEAALGRALTLIRLRRYQAAADRLREARELHPDTAWLAHALARVLAASPEPAVRNGAEALAVMESLSDPDRRLDAGETMAMVLAENGRTGEAAAWQRQAMASARQSGGADGAVWMAERLQRYEAGLPSRSPWSKEELQ